MDIKVRIWAVNDEFPEGKMYYPPTMHDEVDESRGFYLNQFGDVLHGRHVNPGESYYTLIWARIGFNDVTKMLGSGVTGQNNKEIYVGDVVTYWKNGSFRAGVVFYDQGCFQVDGHLLKDLGTLVIQGNIFENPDLMDYSKKDVVEYASNIIRGPFKGMD